MKALLFLLVATLVIGEMVAAREGCTTLGLEREYADVFHSACVNHDRCYDRCQGKYFCGTQFVRDLYAICRGRPGDTKCTDNRKLTV